MKTYVPKASEIERRWHLVDADGKILGRLAARVATLLRGKHKAQFVPQTDVGDFVVVVNAASVRLTGRKLQQKKQYRHSGYPGGFRETTYEVLMRTHPERAITDAVRGMLPKTRQGRKLLRKLKVYRGASHRHEAQKPAPLAL